MATSVTIRPCRSNECANILSLWKDAEATPSITDSIEELRRLVRENGELFLVAEQDNRVVGTVVGGWDGWRGNIYRIAVLPEYRRQGIGKALIQEVERRLSTRGTRRMSILVEHEHPVAISFWDSLEDIGYERDPRMIRYVKKL
ncbi:GNAT family N-acetyltransferase [Chloroflexota bacterium]